MLYNHLSFHCPRNNAVFEISYNKMHLEKAVFSWIKLELQLKALKSS